MTCGNKLSLIIFGNASGRTIKTIPIDLFNVPKIKLMDFLIANGVTLASSCKGEGACKKCIVNSVVLSCQISLEDFIAQHGPRIEIAYL